MAKQPKKNQAEIERLAREQKDELTREKLARKQGARALGSRKVKSADEETIRGLTSREPDPLEAASKAETIKATKTSSMTQEQIIKSIQTKGKKAGSAENFRKSLNQAELTWMRDKLIHQGAEADQLEEAIKNTWVSANKNGRWKSASERTSAKPAAKAKSPARDAEGEAMLKDHDRVAKKAAKAPKPASVVETSFTTEAGSTYKFDPKSGTTVRNKAARTGHPDSGMKTRSGATVFLSPDDADEVLWYTNLKDKNQKMSWEGDKLILEYDQGKGRIRKELPFTRTPEVGKSPIELWDEPEKSIHVGNVVTAVDSPTTAHARGEELVPADSPKGKKPRSVGGKKARPAAGGDPIVGAMLQATPEEMVEEADFRRASDATEDIFRQQGPSAQALETVDDAAYTRRRPSIDVEPSEAGMLAAQGGGKGYNPRGPGGPGMGRGPGSAGGAGPRPGGGGGKPPMIAPGAGSTARAAAAGGGGLASKLGMGGKLLPALGWGLLALQILQLVRGNEEGQDQRRMREVEEGMRFGAGDGGLGEQELLNRRMASGLRGTEMRDAREIREAASNEELLRNLVGTDDVMSELTRDMGPSPMERMLQMGAF